MKAFFITFVFIIVLVNYSFAGIVLVPQEYLGIQAGINAAVNGDTLLVADSTYYENIDFKGKAITVASYFLVDGDSVHIDSTIINGGQPSHPNRGSVISFISGEDTNSVIYGFTITGGTGTLYDSETRVGGGIYCENSAARIMYNKVIDNKVAHNQRARGGGIGIYPQENIRSVIIEKNLIELNSVNSTYGAHGGGIYSHNSNILIAHNKIISNICHSQSSWAIGGGIYTFCENVAKRTLNRIFDNVISYNQAISDQYMYSGHSGGVDSQWCNIEMVRNIITYNKISGPEILVGAGSRIYGAKDSVLVEDNIISFNSFSNGFCAGGGLSVINSNLSETPAKVTITGNRFEGNSGTWGGGLLTENNSGCVVSDNEFIKNFAVEGGGIGDIDSNPFTIINNLFKKNQATKLGGGLSSANSNVYLFKNIFSGNESQQGGGILVYRYETSAEFKARIINNTITANVAEDGGGIGILYYSVTSMNNIFWGNDAPFAPEMLVQGGSVDISYSDIRAGLDGLEIIEDGIVNWLEGNIDYDPLFADTLCHLSPGSPCIDMGNPAKEYNDSDGSRNDMGAYGWSGITSVKQKNQVYFLPEKFILYQNYPNPFNPKTFITYELPTITHVELSIYNLLGQQIVTLVNQKQTAGRYCVEWNAIAFASGMYYYRIEAGDFQDVKKMVLLK